MAINSRLSGRRLSSPESCLWQLRTLHYLRRSCITYTQRGTGPHVAGVMFGHTRRCAIDLSFKFTLNSALIHSIPCRAAAWQTHPSQSQSQHLARLGRIYWLFAATLSDERQLAGSKWSRRWGTWAAVPSEIDAPQFSGCLQWAEPLQLQLHQLHSDCLSVCLSLSLSVWLSVCIGNVVNVLTISAMCVEALQVASASMAAQQQHGSSRILGALQSKSTQWLTDSGTNLQIRRRFTLHALRLTFCACHSNAADNSQGPSHPPPHTSLPPLSQPALQLTGAQGMPGSFWLLPYVVSRNVTRKSNTQKSATTTATATTATATTTAATATTTATTRAVDWVVPMITVS